MWFKQKGFRMTEHVPHPLAAVLSLLRSSAGPDGADLDQVRPQLLEAARLIEIFTASDTTPQWLSTSDEECLFLSRLNSLLPENLTSRQIPMVLSFILDRYSLPMPDVLDALQTTLAFLQHKEQLVSGTPTTETRH
jgi:hypothetical protein